MRDNDREKFIDLAEKRVRRTIKDLRLVANLANKSNYAYTDDDAKKIIKALQNEINYVKEKFENKSSKADDMFTLR